MIYKNMDRKSGAQRSKFKVGTACILKRFFGFVYKYKMSSTKIIEPEKI